MSDPTFVPDILPTQYSPVIPQAPAQPPSTSGSSPLYGPVAQSQIPSQAPHGVPAQSAKQSFWQKLGNVLTTGANAIGGDLSSVGRMFAGGTGSNPQGNNPSLISPGAAAQPVKQSFWQKLGNVLTTGAKASEDKGGGGKGGGGKDYMETLKGFQPPMPDYVPQDVTSAAQQPEIAKLLQDVASMPRTAFGGRPGFLGALVDAVQSMGMTAAGHPELAISSREAQARSQMVQDVMNRAQRYGFTVALNHYLQRSAQLQEALQTAPIAQRLAASGALFRKELAKPLAYYNPANRAYTIDQMMRLNPNMSYAEASALLDSSLNTMGGFQGAINFGNASPNLTASQVGK